MQKIVFSGLAALLMSCETHKPVSQTPAVPEISKGLVYRGIVVEGSLEYQQNIVPALELIYQKDPWSWAIVRDNINTIRYNPPSGMHVYAGIYDTDDNKTTPTKYQPLPWVAGEIVHDAWHREYFHRGEAYDGREGEKKCMERQNEFFRKIGYPLLNIEALLNTRYWDVQQRWW